MDSQNVLFLVVLVFTFSLILFFNQPKRNELSILLNQSKSAYIVMNYSNCEKTGLVVMCGAEVAKALSEVNVTVRPYVFTDKCMDPDQNEKTIDECEKKLLGLGFVIGCGEKGEAIEVNRVIYIGGENELRTCAVANRIRLS